MASKPVYALNLFDVAGRAEYLAYSRRSAIEVEADALADVHPHREKRY
jgi:hypothetical protein